MDKARALDKSRWCGERVLICGLPVHCGVFFVIYLVGLLLARAWAGVWDMDEEDMKEWLGRGSLQKFSRLV